MNNDLLRELNIVERSEFYAGDEAFLRECVRQLRIAGITSAEQVASHGENSVWFYTMEAVRCAIALANAQESLLKGPPSLGTPEYHNLVLDLRSAATMFGQFKEMVFQCVITLPPGHSLRGLADLGARYTRGHQETLPILASNNADRRAVASQRYRLWQEFADQIWERNSSLSRSTVAKRVASEVAIRIEEKQLGEEFAGEHNTIRRKISPPR